MNGNFVSIIKRIIGEQGEAILGDPARLKGFVADYAKNEPKEMRLAFGRCIEAGAYNELKRAPGGAGRQNTKKLLARKVSANTGVELAHCTAALDALEAALFGGAGQPQAAYPPSQYQQPAPQAYQATPQPQYQASQQPTYPQPVYPQAAPQPAVKTGGLWVAVLVLNILGMNWISRLITGHIATGILLLLFTIVAWATVAVYIGVVLLIVYFIIWIVDLVKIGTKKWRMADGTYLAP